MLNEFLYEALRREFHTVKVSHPGEAMTYEVKRDLVINKDRLEIIHSGEEYRVNCPFCNDRRYRLFINHRWGYDDSTLGKNLHLANCYNERCTRKQGNTQALYRRIYTFKNVGERGGVTQQQLGAGAEVKGLEQVQMPGVCHPLHTLPVNNLASVYLRKRGYDPVVLSYKFGLSYCVEADDRYPLTEGRIIIPITMRGELVGWQARYPGDRASWDFLPKYYSCPGMARRFMLYNYDTAVKTPVVVVCEGPADVWRVGPYGVALFGSKMTRQQVELVIASWAEGVVVVALDSDKAGREGSQEIMSMLRPSVPKLVEVRLDSKDPGSYDTGALWDIIMGQALLRGVDLASEWKAEE